MKFMEYVKATRIENLAANYQQRGYDVVVSPIDVSYPFETKAQDYDMVAIKDEHKIAIEVIAFPKLGREAARIALLRRQALKEGFDEFRMVVVRKPRQFPVRVEAIEQTLSHYLSRNMPEELTSLTDGIRVKLVKSVTIDSISIKKEHIRVVGDGILIADIYYSLDGERFWEDDDFPLYFDVELDHRLNIKHVHNIDINTSYF
jgi:hypothetical protein